MKIDDKRQLLGDIAALCAGLLKASRYPNSVFNYPFAGVPRKYADPVRELHIRIPSILCLPNAIRPSNNEPLKPEDRLNIFNSCPAIENIQLHPEFQRLGFLNSLMMQLGYVGYPYVNLSNVENADLSEHFLALSEQAGSGVEVTGPRPELGLLGFRTFSINLKERYPVLMRA